MNRVFLETKLATDETGLVSGIAWPFGTPDRVGDVIEKGAFRSAPARLPMLFAHDQRDAVGVWDSIAESDRGLEVKGRLLVDDVARAREVRALVQAGAVRGLSIGFTAKAAKARPGGGRTITQAELAEVSIVAVPAHPGARIVSAKGSTMEDQNATETPEAEAAAVDVPELIRKALEPVRADVAKVAKVNERLDRIEARLNRPVTDASAGGESLEAKAFTAFVRKGAERIGADEIKALVVSSDTAGGYLAPEQFVSELIRQLVLISPIRQAARVAQMSSGVVVLPKRVGRITAKWVGETETRPQTEPTYGQIQIQAHEMACYVDVSNWLLEDSAIDIAAELAFDFAEEFGRLEGEAFVTGDGVKKPLGILNEPGIPTVNNGHATVLQTDALIKLVYDLPAFYRDRGSWLMNTSSIAAVRLFKDTAGQYIWQEGLTEGQPPTLLGRPVIDAPDMPAIAGNATPIVYGDFQSAFRIYDRVGLSVLRDPYSVQTNGLVRFHARRRVGAAVVLPEALRKLKIAV